MYRANAESAKRKIDNAIRTKNNDKTYETPKNGALTLLALPFVPRLSDEFKHAPEKHDERARNEKQNNRINNLCDDFLEELVENGHY